MLTTRLRHLRVEVTADPAEEPVSLADAKAHCQVIGTDEDDLITSYAVAARIAVEKFLGMQLVTATLEAGFEYFPNSRGRLFLPRHPATAVNSVTYYDTQGTQQTLSSTLWTFVNASPIGYVVPSQNQFWPETRDLPHGENVTIEFAAGYADADSVPDAINNAILMLTRSLYDGRHANLDPEQVMGANPNYELLLGLYKVHNV